MRLFHFLYLRDPSDDLEGSVGIANPKVQPSEKHNRQNPRKKRSLFFRARRKNTRSDASGSEGSDRKVSESGAYPSRNHGTRIETSFFHRLLTLHETNGTMWNASERSANLRRAVRGCQEQPSSRSQAGSSRQAQGERSTGHDPSVFSR